jgi:hypothetical protein
MATNEEYKQMFGEDKPKPKKARKATKAKATKKTKKPVVKEVEVAPPAFNYTQKKAVSRGAVNPDEAKKAIRWLLGLVICFVAVLIIYFISLIF